MSTADLISPDLKKVLRRMKLSPILDTLPERLALAYLKMILDRRKRIVICGLVGFVVHMLLGPLDLFTLVPSSRSGRIFSGTPFVSRARLGYCQKTNCRGY